MDLGLRALEFAFDYAAIADTLPRNRIAAVRRDLETSYEPNPPDETRSG
jgi:hypothetical protein